MTPPDAGVMELLFRAWGFGEDIGYGPLSEFTELNMFLFSEFLFKCELRLLTVLEILVEPSCVKVYYKALSLMVSLSAF
jgi:hypothetical protein